MVTYIKEKISMTCENPDPTLDEIYEYVAENNKNGITASENKNHFGIDYSESQTKLQKLLREGRLRYVEQTDKYHVSHKHGWETVILKENKKL